MSRVKPAGTVLSLLALTALGAHTLKAATVYVGTCGPAATTKYASIQMAVNAVPVGSTILVCPGVYPEQVTITKNLNLAGVQSGTADQVVIAAPASGVVQNTYDLYDPQSRPIAAEVSVQKAQSVNISNITVDGSGNMVDGCTPVLVGIYYQDASGTLQSVVTRNQTLATGQAGCQSGLGIFVQSGYGTAGIAKVTVQSSSVHSFQKNGITGDGSETTLNVLNNYISGQGPTAGAAENGIQISDGAGGTVMNNVVIDEIWSPDMFPDTGDAASGILVYASQNVMVQNNVVGTTQFGIVTVTDPSSGTNVNPMGLGDHTTISGNQVLNTEIYDAIDVCSNNNTIQNNTLSNSAESAIHLDSSCGSTGTNNHVSHNTINEACAGMLQGATPNTISGDNAFYNVVNTIMSGNTCPAASTAEAFSRNTLLNSRSNIALRPSPVR